MKRTDFREFLFTATGRETPLPALPLLDLEDNVNAELRRLQTLAELVQACNPDEVDGNLLKDAGAMLSEVHARLRRIVQIGFEANRSAARRTEPKHSRKSRS
jgi:hypothetical protein